MYWKRAWWVLKMPCLGALDCADMLHIPYTYKPIYAQAKTKGIIYDKKNVQKCTYEHKWVKGTSIRKNSIPYQSPKSMKKNDVILDCSLSKPYMQSKLMISYMVLIGYSQE